MSGSIELVSIEGIEEIAGAIDRSRAMFDAVARSAQETIASYFRQIELRGAALQQEIEDARYALRNLDEDESGAYELERLEDALRQARQWESIARDCMALRRRYEAGLGNLRDRGGNLASQSARAFAEVAHDARTYRQIQLGGTSLGLGEPASAVVIAASGTRETRSDPPPDLPPGAAPPHVGPPLPGGFVWLDLEQLAEDDFVTNPNDFRKESPGTIQRGIGMLRDEIIPLLAAQPGLDADAIQRIDDERGTRWDEHGFPHPDSLSTVWSVFFNPDRSGDTLCVARKAANGMPYLPGGRHRLGIAREMGIRYMPAKVVEA